MDENDLEKQKQDEASRKAAHVAGKGAATYFGGAEGAKLYDLASKTPQVKNFENKLGQQFQQRNPKAVQKLDESGILDAADKGLNSIGENAADNSSSGLGNSSNSIPSNPFNNKQDNQPSNSPSNPLNQGMGDNQLKDNDSFDLQGTFFGENKKKWTMIAAIVGSLISIILPLLISAAMVLGPIEAAKKFITGIWDSIVDFFTKDTKELEKEYYQELKEVQQKINSKSNGTICIDVNLITASLTVNKSFDEMLEEGQDLIEDSEEQFGSNTSGDGYDYEDSSDAEKSEKKNLKRMKKQVRLLANMQVINKKYGLDSKLKADTGTYCSNDNFFELVTSDNISHYDGGKYGEIDSSSMELIAAHDKVGVAKFFSKKSNEETNYAYYIYHPPFDTDGTCSDKYAKRKIKELSETSMELSIGESSNKKESVFYWNLVNSFIPDYYDDYLPDESDPEYQKKVERIADEIYLIYKDAGPSQTCSISYVGPSNLCKDGITVEGVGTLDFEEYVAGVVSNEAYSDAGMEALKAQAVAARTYALNSTNYCQKIIKNSTSAQTFTMNINDQARQAVNETRGEILIDRDGNIFSSQYDSFCYDDKDCPDAIRNSDGTYSVTYTKVPYGETHTITLTDSSQFNRITHGQGHAHGMSQLMSYQLAKEGKTYQEILSYFYSDGVTISLVLSPTTTEDATIVQGPISNYLNNNNSSIESLNEYIYSQVRKAGIGTREGVVAAAVSLVSGFYHQTGYKLPYELYPSGKYNGYGMDSSWGTNTGRSDYPLNGLDCSGFVSWAIHNGGFSYEVKSAKGWGQSSTSRSWSKGTTDSAAKPGDLIYNAPQSENGTTGHIRMIVEVTTDGYVVAEASGRSNGVRINSISFTSTGPYYLVDMSNYYANATVVSDYPS